MDNKIHNPHDRFFKSLMEDRNIAIAFLEEFLPEKVKNLLALEQLAHSSTSFISTELEEYLADVVFNVPLRTDEPERETCFISILLEHKSYIDPYIDFQILQYLAQSYRQQIQNRQKLQLVIPFIYYHGQTKWQKRPLSDFFPGLPEHLFSYFPAFSKVFIDLNDLNLHQIDDLRNIFIRTALSVQKLAREDNQVMDLVLRILNTLEPENDRNFRQVLLVYSLQITRILKETLQAKIEHMTPQIKAEILSTYDQIKLEGKIEGKLEGKLEGKIERNIEVVSNLHDAGMDIDFIMKVTELSKEDVEKIINESRMDK